LGAQSSESFGVSFVSAESDSLNFTELFTDIEQLISAVNTCETHGVESLALPLDLRQTSAATQHIYSALHSVTAPDHVTETRAVVATLTSTLSGKLG
jgi:hypothetical protein